MKRLVLAAVVPLACLVFATGANASWANKLCSTKAENHCYSLARWYPNIHKGIKDVWWYVNPEDVRFSHPTAPNEFLDMESWVSWAEPGFVVEYPMEETYWVEAGETWTSHGCEFFTSANGKWGEGYYNFVEAACTGHNHQLFKVQREPTKEICVYWNSNPSWCFEPGFLPEGNFTQLNSGLEISSEYKPTSVRGNVEAFALGGTNNWWEGARKASYIYTREHATCVYKHSPGPGSISFTSGDACPTGFEEPGPGVKWKEENEEEAKGAAAATPFSQTGSGESEPPPAGEEEPNSQPETGRVSPASQVDTFAGFSRSGYRAKLHDREAALAEVAEANPSGEVEVFAANSTYEHTGASKHGKLMATSPGQEALLHSDTYTVEVEAKQTLEVTRDGKGGVEVVERSPYLTVPRSGTLAGAEAPEGENLRFVYDAKTGHLDQIAWSTIPTAHQSERIEHRKEMFLDAWELDSFHKSGGPHRCRQEIAEGRPARCEAIFAKERDYKAKLKADKAALKAQRKREKQEAKEELKREKELSKAARASALPPQSDPRFGHLTYDEVSAAPPVASVSVYHHGYRLHTRRGPHMRVHLRVGRRYTFVARGAGLRCARNVRIRHVGQAVRLRWRDCKRG